MTKVPVYFLVLVLIGFLIGDQSSEAFECPFRSAVPYGCCHPYENVIQSNPSCSHAGRIATILWVLPQDDKDVATKIDSISLSGYGLCTSVTLARRFLVDQLGQSEAGRRFGSVAIPAGASSRAISDGELAIQTRLVNRKYKITELIELSGDRDADRASAAVLSVFLGSTLSALAANQSLPGPEILRFLVVWAFSFAPLALVGYGIADADKLQTLLVAIQRRFFPAYRQRMIQHEAGHFLLAHLLGWPIKGYRANAVKNAVEFFPFSDADRAADRAQLLGFDGWKSRADADVGEDFESDDVPFFSSEGRGSSLLDQRSVTQNSRRGAMAFPLRDDPTSSWPYRGFSEAELDQLAVISVAGVCAEILSFGDAEGGVADLSQLRQIFGSADRELSARDVDNRVRFALAFALTQLRRHLGLLDALAAVMERGGSVEECVTCLETSDLLVGRNGILGDDELRRRQTFREQRTSLIEKLFLGRERNIDAAENRFVEGKGGGYKKESRRLTGDDPLYAALAVSLAFLVWAGSGGLSLH